MESNNKILRFGEEVKGLSIPVLNEREGLNKMETILHKDMRALSSGRFLIISLLSIFFLQPGVLNGQRNNLVTAQWLSENLGNPGIVILDASTVQVYKTGHIPGALNYDLFSYGPKELPSSEIEKRLQSWGISEGKKVIIYDQGGTMMATFLFFTLDYYGFPAKDMLVLDGGLSRWKETGYQVTAEITPQPVKGSFRVSDLNTGVKASLPEFLEASGDPENNSLVEALDPDWHYGDINVFGRKGHIPHATMLPVADFYNPDKTFKSNEEILKIAGYLGIDQGKNVYTHCGGGIAASVPYFVMKYLMGWQDVRLFRGSLLEWASDERELPLWTFDAPYLIRDAAWLQAWNGRMMRMYGMSNLSLVDVRSTGEFREGHLENSVNLQPGDLLSNFTDQGKMAEALSLAGVDASDEAVIISGGGLTKEAALAFAALEKAGQKKISVFMDPKNKWEANGLNIFITFALSKNIGCSIQVRIVLSK
jgi:thiosulfate/3-mercaptopyruvate sulfurtransferase